MVSPAAMVMSPRSVVTVTSVSAALLNVAVNVTLTSSSVTSVVDKLTVVMSVVSAIAAVADTPSKLNCSTLLVTPVTVAVISDASM